MNRIIYLLCFVLLLASCKEKFVDRQSLEEAERNAYLQENNISDAYKQSNGSYFIPEIENDNANIEAGKYIKYEQSIWLTNGKRLVKGQTLYYIAGEELLYNGIDIMQGLNQAFLTMGKGEKAKVILPSELAYGGNSFNAAPPYSTLIFELEILSADLEADEQEGIANYIANSTYNFESISDEDVEVYFATTQAVTVVDGEPALPEDGDSFTINYTGSYLNGNKFQSGELDVTVGAGELVEGFELAITQLREGETGIVIIPFEHGYGTQGQTDPDNLANIPPFATLVFEIERTVEE